METKQRRKWSKIISKLGKTQLKKLSTQMKGGGFELWDQDLSISKLTLIRDPFITELFRKH